MFVGVMVEFYQYQQDGGWKKHKAASWKKVHQLFIVNFMHRLRKEKNIIIMVSPDLNLATMFASRILLLQEGKVLRRSSQKELLVPETLQEVYDCRMHVDDYRLSTPPIAKFGFDTLPLAAG